MKVSYTPPKNSTIVILCDGEPWREIHSAVFGRKPNLPKEVDSLSDLANKFQDLELKAAQNYAYRRLSARNMLSEALKKSLCDRFVTPSIAEQVVFECQKHGYIDDAVWVEGFVRSQFSRKSGPALIMAKLRAKGVPKQFAEEVIAELDSPEARAERIQKLLITRYRKRDLSNYAERRKVINSLLLKGFPLDEVVASLVGA